MRTLVPLETLKGMTVDVAAAERVAEDAAERGQDPLDGPRRKILRAELARERDDVLGCDQGQTAPAEPGQQLQA